MNASDLKPGMVVRYLYNKWSVRPNRFMVIEGIEDGMVVGYRCLRNGEEGDRAWGNVRRPLEHVIEIVKGIEL